MENTIIIVLVLAGICVFLLWVGVYAWKYILNFMVRCLSGLVIIYVVNYAIQYYGGNLAVKINEIAMGFSGILGIGALFSYMLYSIILQLYLKNFVRKLHKSSELTQKRFVCYSCGTRKEVLR